MIHAAATAAADGVEVRVLAMPRGASPGTRDCIKRALRAGLEVVVRE
jgi:hypothetical protein